MTFQKLKANWKRHERNILYISLVERIKTNSCHRELQEKLKDVGVEIDCYKF